MYGNNPNRETRNSELESNVVGTVVDRASSLWLLPSLPSPFLSFFWLPSLSWWCGVAWCCYRCCRGVSETEAIIVRWHDPMKHVAEWTKWNSCNMQPRAWDFGAEGNRTAKHALSLCLPCCRKHNTHVCVCVCVRVCVCVCVCDDRRARQLRCLLVTASGGTCRGTIFPENLWDFRVMIVFIAKRCAAGYDNSVKANGRNRGGHVRVMCEVCVCVCVPPSMPVKRV